MVTADHVFADITARLGFVPPFFLPAAATPVVLEHLWRQTCVAYLDLPLPALFIEKLATYLSRYCAVPYCLVCHSCTLPDMNMSASEILDLLETPMPDVAMVARLRQQLQALPPLPADWPTSLACSQLVHQATIVIFLKLDPTGDCQRELLRVLGPTDYHYIIAFLAYLQTCYTWMEANPNVAYTDDLRAQRHLAALCSAEPRIELFFRDYPLLVRSEQERRDAQLLAEIAERQRSEAAVRESYQLLHGILEGTSDPIFAKNIHGKYVLANAAAARLLGSPVGSVIGCDDSAFFPPEYAATLHANDQWLLQHGGTAVYEETVPIDGTLHTFLSTKTIYSDATGAPAGIVGVSRDITERKRAEQERENLLAQIADDRAQLQAILHQLPIGVLIAEMPSGRILEGNAQVEQIIGQPFPSGSYDPSAASWRAFHNDGRPYEFNEWPLLRGLTTGVWVRNEQIEFVREDGSRVAVDVSVAPITNRQGQQTAAVVTLTDVTKQRQLQAQLLQVQKMESIGRLAGGIAHDFNNLLTAIGGSAAMILEQHSLAQDVREDLGLIVDTVERAAALTRQLMTFARRQQLSMTAVNLNTVVKHMQPLLARLIGVDIQIDLRLSPRLPVVQGDVSQLEQVLLNLAVNARDAMPHGGTLTITTSMQKLDRPFNTIAQELQPGVYAVLEVQDTGIGMPPEVQARLFEPFFTTKAPGHGTGLGLATCYGIIQQHGGTLTCSSAVGHGTTFQMYLPSSAEQRHKTIAADPSHNHLQGTETVLLVDDEQVIRSYCGRVLRGQGYRVLEASDGDAALDMLAQPGFTVDLVLTDLAMPHMSGEQLFAEVRRRYPHVKFLVMSGHTATTSLPLTDSDAVVLLPKPFAPHRLLAAVRSSLDKRIRR